jgi:hypothetical protein
MTAQTSEAVEMMAKAMKQWEELSVDKDFEICTRFPYYIRKKGTTEYLQDIPSGDYRVYSLNGRVHLRHRLIATQWLPNPNNLPQVHHKNGDPHDNHLDNLMWVTAKTNQCNKFRYRDREIVFKKTLTGSPIAVEFYGKWRFENLWYSDNRFYSFTGLAYRELPEYEMGPYGALVTEACDVDGRQHLIYYAKFQRLYNL